MPSARSLGAVARAMFAAVLVVACTRDGAKVTDASAPSEAAASAQSAPVVDAGADADIVTHASWLADAGGGVRTAESVDGDALRAKHRPRLAQKLPVTVLRGMSARELGERICKEVVPERPHDAPVLIKPNLGGFDW